MSCHTVMSRLYSIYTNVTNVTGKRDKRDGMRRKRDIKRDAEREEKLK